MPAWQSWQSAWQRALYADGGFYRSGAGPASHYATSAQGAPGLTQAFARALAGWAEREGWTTLVDIGAGRGELLRELGRVAPWLRLLGVDVVPRPTGLPDAAGWLTSPGGGDLPDRLADLTRVLVVANEWLDVVPCTVAEAGDDGAVREVEVRADGRERLGRPLGGADLAWCRRWWPIDQVRPGERVEVGRARDLAFAGLCDRVRQGCVVAIDYGHRVDARPPGGTLTGHRDGRAVPPVPDGSCDLTAHVALDSLPAEEVIDQRTALRRLGLAAGAPPRDLARADPATYLAALAKSSAATALTDPGGLGGFGWAIRRAGPARPGPGPAASSRRSR